MVTLILQLKKKSKNLFLLGTAAILHDVVEDCGVSVDEIAQKFGHNVAAIVGELTSDKEEIEKVGKAAYLAQSMVDMSSYALTIKLCDRLDNLSDLAEMSYDKAVEKANETRTILSFLELYRDLSKTQKKLVKKIYRAIDIY